ncbi:MAG: histidine phosphatase family protein [Dongiaceae bacterium]
MIRLALLRHAPTEWNEQGRVQGSSDVALSAAGRKAASSWRLPPSIATWRRVTSPLSRCRETGSLLHPKADAQIEPRLIEMSWGKWEGRRLTDLRAELGDDMIAREILGLDFHAPGGESPRAVQARVRPWLAEIGAAGIDTLAITHKGVVRAIYALATGWTMEAREPDRLRFPAIHLVRVEPDGRVAPERFNLPLDGRADSFA